ncbi:MAG: sugar ABC transporter permease [Promicromonosporaceae bacterium]|nr:sugar ABC transporter permease [Promicromonosporaceae bacterium]
MTALAATGAAVASRRRTGPNPVLLVPALAFFLVFAIVPLVGAFVLSFTTWDGLSPLKFTGLTSWRHVLGDAQTFRSLLLTLKVMVVAWVVQTPVSLLLGVFVAGRQRYRALLGVLYFVPLLLSSAAVAIAFKNAFDPNFGIGAAFHLPFLVQDWLGDPSLVFYVVIFVISWQFVPLHTLFYQAGTRGIPAQLYEAATLDGAGRVKQFWYITLPQLRNTIIMSSTLMVVGSLTYFDVVFVLTGGGPGNATRLLALQMYLTGFQSYQMGPASALSVILVVIGLAMAFALTKFSGFARMKSDQEGM